MAKDTKKGRKARRQALTVDRELLERANRIYDQLSRTWFYVAEVQKARAALWPLIGAWADGGECPGSEQLSLAMRTYERIPEHLRNMIEAEEDAPLTREQWDRAIRTNRVVSVMDFVKPVTGASKRGVVATNLEGPKPADMVEVYVNPGVSRADAIHGLSLVMGSMQNEGWWNDTFVKNGKSGASDAPAVADVEAGNGRQPTAA